MQTTGEPPPSPLSGMRSRYSGGALATTASLNSPRIGGQGGEKGGNEVETSLCVNDSVIKERVSIWYVAPVCGWNCRVVDVCRST